jgi:hypothetical protein
MAFHIVTSKCFIACEKVTSVIIEQLKPAPKKEGNDKYLIKISYLPTASSNSNYSSSEEIVEIVTYGKEETYSLYAEIIKEIQEQFPNEAYLDLLINKILAGKDFQIK